jgi:hypothetical protein
MSCLAHKSNSLGSLLSGQVGRRPTIRALLLAALTCASAVAAPAFADAPDTGLDSVLASLAQHRHGHALYSEQIDSALFKHPLHASGELFFDAPDRLEKKALVPAAEDLLVQGDVITIARGAHRTSMRLSDYPQFSPLLNAIRATLAGDRASLEKTFQISFDSSGSGWELTLQPLPSEPNPVYKHIQIRGIDGTVKSVSLERANGERTTMTLSAPTDS